MTSSPAETGPGVIVVGVDGSPGAQAALDFALAEAALRHCRVEAVAAWDYPVTDEARTALAAAVDVAGERFGGPAAPPITSTVLRGPSAEMLIAAARDAALLVVGARGHGGFAGLLLGSVSHACVTRAPCPVVVVPQAGARTV